MGRKIWRVVSTLIVIAVLLMLATVFVQRITGKEPSLFGYRMNYIRTGSMDPTIKEGDVILCRNVDADAVAKGDIITYTNDGRLTSLPAGQTVCHRVVEEPYTEDGEIHLTTKGDANGASDPEIVGSQVIGRFVRKLTVMTLFYKVFLTKWGFLIVIIPLALMLVLELYGMVHSKDKSQSEPDKGEPEGNNKDKTGEADGTV